MMIKYSSSSSLKRHSINKYLVSSCSFFCTKNITSLVLTYPSCRLYLKRCKFFRYLSESNTATQDHEGTNTDWKGGGGGATIIREEMSKTPFGMQSAVQNAGKVKFDPPKVPVIFILGEKSHVKNI